jgi:hypothetical protein
MSVKLSSKPRQVEDASDDVARLDKTMRDERQKQGAAWTEILKRRLDRRFEARKSA